MSPSHHPEPPERALEPQFVAAQGLGVAQPTSGGSRLDGPTPTRTAGRSLLPWVLLAAVVAAAAWAIVTVVLPLRREAVQCQAQLLAAQSAFAVPADMEPAAAEDDGATAGGTTTQDRVDALVERLVMVLGPEAALGQVAVHPDEGCVRVVVPSDVAGREALGGVFARVGQQIRAMPTPWRVVLEVGRPVWPSCERESSKLGLRGKHKRKSSESESVRLLLGAQAAADRAFADAQVPWVTRLIHPREGGVELRLEAGDEAAGQAVP